MTSAEKKLAWSAAVAAIVLVGAAAALSIRYGEGLYFARLAAGLAGCL